MWELLIQANVSSGTFSRGFKLLTITSLKSTACTTFQSKMTEFLNPCENIFQLPIRPKFVDGKAVSEDVSKSSICWRIADNWRLYSRLIFFGWHVVKHSVQRNFQQKNWKCLAIDKVYLTCVSVKACFQRMFCCCRSLFTFCSRLTLGQSLLRRRLQLLLVSSDLNCCTAVVTAALELLIVWSPDSAIFYNRNI